MTLSERLRALDRPTPVQLGLAAVALVVVVVLMLIIFGGQREKQAVAEVKAAAPVAAKVAETQKAEAAVVNTATEKVRTNVVKGRERARRDVEALHVAVASAPPGDPDGVVDRTFYQRMCGWRFYTNRPVCDGYRGGSEGSRPRFDPRALLGGRPSAPAVPDEG